MTSNTRLATALLFLGHTLRRPPCTRQVRNDGRTIVTFLFHPSTKDAPDTCAKLAGKWMRLEEQDPGDATPDNLKQRVEFLSQLARSDSPMDRAYANAGWRDICLSIVKSTPRMVEITSGNGFGFVREDATPAEMKSMQKYL